MLPIKRKFKSAVWRLKHAAILGYHSSIKYLVEAVTEKHWLLDYLPTFFKKKEGVLLVRLDLIGDFVLWLDSAQAYRRLYPRTKITLVVNSACGELAEALPHWDNVIGVDVHKLRTNYLYRFGILTRLRWHNFATAIQPTFSRELVGDITVRASNAPNRLGYEGDLHNITKSLKAKADHWYTRLIVNDLSQTMELNVNAHFVRQLGCPDFLSNVPVIPPIKSVGSRPILAHPYIVICPGASWRPRMWPVEKFAELIEHLQFHLSVHIVLCGGKDESSICEELVRKTDDNSIINLTGKTTLIELTNVIRSAELVISNESSPIHIAAAVNTPSVCIQGGGHFGRFLPYQVECADTGLTPIAIFEKMECFNCHWRCKFLPEAGATVPCVTGVTTNQVFKICGKVLGIHSNKIG